MATRRRFILAAGLGSALLIANGASVTAQAQPATEQAPVAEPTPPSEAAGALPTPPGATAAQVTAGMALFKGRTCAACHGQDAAGGAIGPDLTTGSPLWTDGTLAGITDLISKGVPAPKKYRSPMPPMGGMQLAPDDLAAISAYVWAVGHQKK